eukprot:scaffold7315_cov18-Tisochrysis_lutea.AAC.1
MRIAAAQTATSAAFQKPVGVTIVNVGVSAAQDLLAYFKDPNKSRVVLTYYLPTHLYQFNCFSMGDSALWFDDGFVRCPFSLACLKFSFSHSLLTASANDC